MQATTADGVIVRRVLGSKGVALLVACAFMSVVGCVVGVAGAGAARGFTSTVSFSGQGSGPGQLSNPQRSAIRASSGELFVADRDNDRVQIFNTATNAVVDQFGDASVTDDPFGVAVDQSTGDVYVSSSASNTITKWADLGLGYVQDMLFVSPAVAGDPVQAGQLGSFAAPLAVDPATGALLVADPTLQVVNRYDSNGVFQSSFTGDSSPGGQAFGALKDIAIDAGGDVFVIDGGRVVRFDGVGGYEATLDAVPGPGVVAVDPSTGTPVVASNADDGCAVDRIASYDGTTLESMSQVPPSPGDCAFPSGLAFTAAGLLYVSTKDVCDGSCGGQPAIHVLDRTPTLAYTATATPATNITETTARLRGSLDPAGGEVVYSFEYTADGSSWISVGEQGPFDDPPPVPAQANVAGLVDATSYTYRLAIRSVAAPGITGYSNSETFTTLDGEPPTAQIDAPSGVTSGGATLNGSANPNGQATGVRFELSGDAGGNWTALAGPDNNPGSDDPIGNGTSDVSVSATTPGLEPNREYLTRVTATSAIGSASSDGSVTTLPEQATVGGASIAWVTATAVRLTASVNPRNSDTTWRFDYGPTDSYGSQTSDEVAASTLVVGGPDDPFDPATPAQAVGTTIAGLTPGVEYHYRLVADNGHGTPTETADGTFTTPAVLEAPKSVTGSITDITANGAKVSGTVDTHGYQGTARFTVAQSNGGHSQSIGPVDLAAIDGPQQVTATATGLPAGGTYTARIAATTTAGEGFGETVAFSTPAPPAYQPPPAVADSNDWPTITPEVPPTQTGPSNRFTTRSKVRGTAATLTIAIPGPGTIKAAGKRIATVVKHPGAKGDTVLRVTLTKAGRKALANAKNAKLAVKITVTYTPTGGTPRTATTTITFKRKASR